MSKNKKKSKKKVSLYKTIQPYIPNKQVLYSILGVAGAGLAIGTALGKDKRQALVRTVTSKVKTLKGSSAAADSNTNKELALG